MANEDCGFLVGFIACIVSFVCYLVSFTNKDWTYYKDGKVGLWVDCFTNTSLPASKQLEECKSTAKAEGPVFLEIARTLMILGLIFHIMGVIGYNFFLVNGSPITCKDQLKARLQEISYFTAGVLIMLGCVFYGMNYYSYYTETVEYTEVKLQYCFYLAAVSAGMNIIFSIVLAVNRDTGLRKAIEDKQEQLKLKLRNKKKDNAQSSDLRVTWLQDKKMLTPTAQKKEEVVDVNDEVEVKHSTLKQIVTPTNVMLAFNRLKSGKTRKQEKDEIKRGEREIETLEFNDHAKHVDTDGKYKGIFVIDIDNKANSTPPSTSRLSTPRRKVTIVPQQDTIESESSSESSITSSTSSDDEELKVTAANGAVLPSAAAASTAQPSTENKGSHRPKPKRSVTTLQGDSPNWAVGLNDEAEAARKKPPRRHLSHDPRRTPSDRARTPAMPAAPPAMNIYEIPTYIKHPIHLPPPVYEEVVSTVNHGDVPEPVMTEQSKIYQPYSKR